MLHVDVDDTTALVGCTRARARDLTQERIGAQCISHELAAEVRGYDEEDDEDDEALLATTASCSASPSVRREVGIACTDATDSLDTVPLASATQACACACCRSRPLSATRPSCPPWAWVRSRLVLVVAALPAVTAAESACLPWTPCFAAAAATSRLNLNVEPA